MHSCPNAALHIKKIWYIDIYIKAITFIRNYFFINWTQFLKLNW